MMPYLPCVADFAVQNVSDLPPLARPDPLRVIARVLSLTIDMCYRLTMHAMHPR